MKIKFDTYRTEDINYKLTQAGFYPLDIMVTGVTGAGKSTTLNSFFQKCVAKVGDGVAPETMALESYVLNEVLRIWDTPGVGDGVEEDRIHKRKMVSLLTKTYSHDGNNYGFIDMVIVIVEGSKRDMGMTYSLLNEVIVPNIQTDRLLVLINQADLAMSGRHWNYTINMPDPYLLEFLEKQAYSIKKRVKEATGVNISKPIYYSAEYGYNVKEVFDYIIDCMPIQRRILIK